MFPEVITVDCTADTNNEARPLLTMAGKDSYGRMFIFLRAFLPNERNWGFRWIFSIVLPNFFHQTILSRIRLIISDGDAQECTSIDNAVNLYFPQVKRGRCGWHLVDRNFDTAVLSKSSFPGKESNFDSVTLIIKNWIYSWMKYSCENEAEFHATMRE